MRKQLGFVAVLMLSIFFVLSGCMEKSKEDIVSDLEKNVKSLSGYKADAKLTIKAGMEPQQYDVSVWYQKPDSYRVYLKNVKKDQSQIILRNKEGVFVLTPALNKSFKFQSTWPKNSSQIYLYESLIKDIVTDKTATFTKNEKNYVFVTKTNYQNSNLLPEQEITLSKELEPVSVKLMDKDKNVVFLVEFKNVKFNSKFGDKDFDVSKNMSDAQKEDVPTSTRPLEELNPMYPTQLPEGVSLKEEKTFSTDSGKRIVLTYKGKKSFTIIQERAKPAMVNAMTAESGEPVDLGFAIGTMTENSLSWINDGVEYTIASGDIKVSEAIQMAQSMSKGIKK